MHPAKHIDAIGNDEFWGTKMADNQDFQYIHKQTFLF